MYQFYNSCCSCSTHTASARVRYGSGPGITSIYLFVIYLIMLSVPQTRYFLFNIFSELCLSLCFCQWLASGSFVSSHDGVLLFHKSVAKQCSLFLQMFQFPLLHKPFTYTLHNTGWSKSHTSGLFVKK